MQTRQKPHEAYQALTPAMEKALNEWALKMDVQGFPPRLDIFKAVVEKLAQEEGRDSLGPTWLRGYLNQHPVVSACFASTMDCQRAFANALGPIKGYFRKLRDAITRYKIKEDNMWNIGEKGFTLGIVNHTKDIAHTGRHPP